MAYFNTSPQDLVEPQPARIETVPVEVQTECLST
jgi:hypothetical protein